MPWGSEGAGRFGWRFSGRGRPPFAAPPGPGQESVWDYPRPPRVETDPRRVVVRVGDLVIAESVAAVRVLETASPPTFYLPPADVREELLERADGVSFCEWKGQARYWNVLLPDRCLDRAAWSYPRPRPGFEAIRGFLSFYPAVVECRVGSERARPQPGSFYGGWVTSELVGPFKGEPGSEGW